MWRVSGLKRTQLCVLANQQNVLEIKEQYRSMVAGCVFCACPWDMRKSCRKLLTPASSLDEMQSFALAHDPCVRRVAWTATRVWPLITLNHV